MEGVSTYFFDVQYTNRVRPSGTFHVRTQTLPVSRISVLFRILDDVQSPEKLGGSVHTLNVNTEALVVASKEIGLEVYADKTKYMVMYRDKNAGQSHIIKTDNSSFGRVEQFRYLGTTLTNQILFRKKLRVFFISDFRRDLNIVYFLLGISPASNCSWPTFRNTVSVPSSKAGCTVWCTPSL